MIMMLLIYHFCIAKFFFYKCLSDKILSSQVNISRSVIEHCYGSLSHMFLYHIATFEKLFTFIFKIFINKGIKIYQQKSYYSLFLTENNFIYQIFKILFLLSFCFDPEEKINR